MESKKPHAVCIPYPAQGHITPMFKLAKLLHSKGFCITFVNTEFNHRRLLKARGPSYLDGLPDFHFESIPDGLPPSKDDVTQDIPSLCLSTKNTCLPHFRNVIEKINDANSGLPAVSCIVSDGAMSFTLDAAKEFGLPEVLFWTTSAVGYMCYIHFLDLVERGLTPLKDESDFTNGYLDTPVDWVPGLKNIRLKDFPAFIRTLDPNEIMVHFNIEQLTRASMASAIILNTFYDLESTVLDAMPLVLRPPVLSIGPLSLLTRQIIPSNSPVISLNSNLWPEETSCLQWLDGKEDSSVVYVNFGSITVMTAEELIEFAWGLANSGHNFLWMIRPDLVKGNAAVLPEEFLEETKERGLLATWCAQEDVLMHRAIGLFLTHNGWNSTLESISGGVPMLGWPFFAEQQTNCRYMCMEWGIGMEIDDSVKREVIEGLVRDLMGGEKGKEMRKNAKKWKESAAKATKVGGSSFVNFEKLTEVLNPKNS